MESCLISRSSAFGADPLSDVLALVKARGFMAGGLDLGEDWSYAFAADDAFRCFAVVSGSCWLRLDGGAAPILIGEGEVFALPHRRFWISSDPAIQPVDIYAELRETLNGRVLTLGGGRGCCLFGAIFTLRQDFARHLLDALPPLLHISDPEDRAALRAYLDRIMALLVAPRPGSALVTGNLAETMLVEVLHLHLTRHGGRHVGWLFALSDPRLGRAVTAMHARPSHPWTVRQLADCAGMSRSSFALRFKERVGISAIGYLVRWRMILAADRLATSSDPVGSMASAFGYESESAFIFAFRREMGCTPRQYRSRTLA